jgi:hypothetical protein
MLSVSSYARVGTMVQLSARLPERANARIMIEPGRCSDFSDVLGLSDVTYAGDTLCFTVTRVVERVGLAYYLAIIGIQKVSTFF